MCLGIMATEGYHAGAVREQLIQQAFDPVIYYSSMKVYQVTGVRAVPETVNLAEDSEDAADLVLYCSSMQVFGHLLNREPSTLDTERLQSWTK